jgi:hypothetical protein
VEFGPWETLDWESTNGGGGRDGSSPGLFPVVPSCFPVGGRPLNFRDALCLGRRGGSMREGRGDGPALASSRLLGLAIGLHCAHYTSFPYDVYFVHIMLQMQVRHSFYFLLHTRHSYIIKYIIKQAARSME